MQNTCRVLYANEVVGESDCNCACPVDHNFRRPNEISFDALARAKPGAGLRLFALEDGWQAVYHPTEVHVTAINGPAARLLDSYGDETSTDGLQNTAAAIADLYQRRILIDPAVQHRVQIATTTTLTAWLHLTGACNFHCSYCYVDHVGQRMQPETARVTVEKLFSIALTKNFGAVKLKYAGGEPGLVFPLVRQIHTQAQEIASHNGLELDAVFLTNGTLLTEEKLRYLKGANIRLMISLDGIGAVNDAQRLSNDGRSAFTRIDQAISLAIANGLPPHLSITVTAQNVDHLPEVVQYALERNLRFNINFYRTDGDLDSDPLYPRPEALIAGVRRAFQIIERQMPSASLLSCLDISNFSIPHHSACGAGESYLTIQPSGQFSCCQMQMERMSVGMHTAELFEAVNDIAREHIGEPGLPEECAACAWRYGCAGGCALFAENGKKTRSPYCAVYQELFPDLIRLEGKRLINQMKQ